MYPKKRLYWSFFSITLEVDVFGTIVCIHCFIPPIYGHVKAKVITEGDTEVELFV